MPWGLRWSTDVPGANATPNGIDTRTDRRPALTTTLPCQVTDFSALPWNLLAKCLPVPPKIARFIPIGLLFKTTARGNER